MAGYRTRNKMNKYLIIIFCFIIISCNKIEDEIVYYMTVQELIVEFSNNWESANKFYKGKRIIVSGVPVFPFRETIVFGINSLDNDSLTAYYKENITIECLFKNMIYKYNLDINNELMILGEYKSFYNLPNLKCIKLENCIPVFGKLNRNFYLEESDI